MNRNIILASGSANRKAVMDALNIPYQAIPADIDEKAIQDKDFGKRAERVARAKAEKVASNFKDAIIISGDSYALNNGKVFEKPSSIEEAKQMLRDQSEGQGTFYAGFCYIDQKEGINFSTTLEVGFSLRKLSEDEIEKYVESNPVLTWSGALFPGNAYGASMIKEIKGSLSAFIYGLPSELLISYLQKSGVMVHP